jgi:hypothetical protein
MREDVKLDDTLVCKTGSYLKSLYFFSDQYYFYFYRIFLGEFSAPTLFGISLIKYVCQQYLTCMCFLGFIWYNKTFIACGLRKYENLFTHEYHIPLGKRKYLICVRIMEYESYHLCNPRYK